MISLSTCPSLPRCGAPPQHARVASFRFGLIAALLVLLPPLAAATDAPAYALDPVHTRVMFAVEHAGLSKALGTVSGSVGVLRFDPLDWTRARLDVRVPLTLLDLGDARWNAATLARNLLDAARFPQARFVSTQVQPRDATHALMCGELSLRGVTRPLCLEVVLNALKRHPLPPFRRTAGFSATGTLSRKDFGIDAWPGLIGDAVELRIEAEAVRTDGAAAEGLGAPEPVPDAPPQVGAELLFDDELEHEPEPAPLPPADHARPPGPDSSASNP